MLHCDTSSALQFEEMMQAPSGYAPKPVVFTFHEKPSTPFATHAQGWPPSEGLRPSRPKQRVDPAERLLVKCGHRYIFVKPETIRWVEAEDNYVRLHVEDTSHLVRQTMAGILSRLGEERFRRIHRSAIVNLDYVKEVQPWSSGDQLVILKDGTRLTLSRTYRGSFGEWL